MRGKGYYLVIRVIVEKCSDSTCFTRSRALKNSFGLISFRVLKFNFLKDGFEVLQIRTEMTRSPSFLTFCVLSANFCNISKARGGTMIMPRHFFMDSSQKDVTSFVFMIPSAAFPYNVMICYTEFSLCMDISESGNINELLM